MPLHTWLGVGNIMNKKILPTVALCQFTLDALFRWKKMTWYIWVCRYPVWLLCLGVCILHMIISITHMCDVDTVVQSWINHSEHSSTEYRRYIHYSPPCPKLSFIPQYIVITCRKHKCRTIAPWEYPICKWLELVLELPKYLKVLSRKPTGHQIVPKGYKVPALSEV